MTTIRSTPRQRHFVFFLWMAQLFNNCFLSHAFSITSNSVKASRTILSASVAAAEKSGPAKNFEEDLQLTLAIIMDHMDRSTTVSKEQFLQQMDEVKKIESIPPPKIDISVPYDAAAQLAYQAAGSVGSFDQFKKDFETKAVADVIAKKQQRDEITATKVVPAASVVVAVDVSVPYDAAARLAYEASTDKTISFDKFKIEYETKAVTDVIKKREQREGGSVKAAAAPTAVDVSVPYDAAARLAYEASSDKSISFDVFKVQYAEKAVAEVIAKRSGSSTPPKTTTAAVVVDLSVPYDAAAQNSYSTLSDEEKSKMSYPEFKIQYEKDAVADVIRKRELALKK
jgi:uncharacterized protein (DUF2252 family)